ncbi:MAG: response regulator, partial [Gemmatimonadota bacterium]
MGAGDDGPVWPGESRLRLVREVSGRRMGRDAGASGAPGPVLSSVRDLDSDGDRILVLDGDAARVAVLDSAGSLLRRVGRRGAGPGELRTPERVVAGQGGGVAVFERRPAVVHRWAADGSYAGRSRPLNRATSTTSSAAAVRPLADWGPRLPEGRAVRLVSLASSDPSAGRSAIHLADSAGRLGPALVTWSREGTPSRLPEVFGARRSCTAGVGPGGEGRIVVARGDRYRIHVHDARGRLRHTIRRDVDPVPVDDGLRDRALARFVEEATRAGAPPTVARDLRERLPVAESLPVTGGVWHSPPDGRLWVGIPGPGREGESPSAVVAYDVYTATNGEEALDQVEEVIPDLIISDIMMPKMDGFALQSALQSDKNT